MSTECQVVIGALKENKQGRVRSNRGKGSHFKQGGKVAFDQRPEEAKEQDVQISRGKSIPGGENSKCKCPGAAKWLI